MYLCCSTFPAIFMFFWTRASKGLHYTGNPNENVRKYFKNSPKYMVLFGNTYSKSLKTC